MPYFSYTCFPSGLYHLIVNVIIYTHCSIVLFQSTEQKNYIKAEKKTISQSDDPAETTDDRSDPDFVFPLKVLDCILWVKNSP